MSRKVTLVRKAFSAVLLLVSTVSLTKWFLTGGIGSNQVELLVVSLAGLWLGSRIWESRGQIG